MIVMGIDPGLKATGYGVISRQEGRAAAITLKEAGSVEPKQKSTLPEKVHKIYLHIGNVIREYHPDVCVLEKLYAHARFPTTSFVLGHARGVICLLCAQHGIPCVEYSVKRIRKSVVGNGNATKAQTRTGVADILKVNAEKLTLDASDAIALALGYAYMN